MGLIILINHIDRVQNKIGSSQLWAVLFFDKVAENLASGAKIYNVNEVTEKAFSPLPTLGDLRDGLVISLGEGQTLFIFSENKSLVFHQLSFSTITTTTTTV